MKDSKKRTPPNWESICKRCGRCCYEKIDFEGRIYYTDLPCEYLEADTNHCRVYSNRETARPGCVKLTTGNVAGGFLPADCPYVKNLEGYIAPVMPEDEEGSE